MMAMYESPSIGTIAPSAYQDICVSSLELAT